jgi:FMN phosphatase YigB (HAD superfamily)
MRMPIRNKISAVLFDADGVVIHPPFRFMAYLETEIGISRKLTQDFFHDDFQACAVGEADMKQVLAPHLLGWGWKTSVDDFMHRFTDYFPRFLGA